jgi:hypothetical protein
MATCVLTNSGCITLAANMLHAIRGNDAPAEFDGLKEKRFAIVCSTSGPTAGEAATSMLTSHITMALIRNLPKADIVRQDEVDQAIEREGLTDIARIGQTLKADHLVRVQVDNLRLRDGATLFRGQSDVKVSVYDIKNNGRLVFEKEILEHSFPRNGGTPITDTTETKFRSAYLQLVGLKVSSLFHPVDATFDVALDATATKF